MSEISDILLDVEGTTSSISFVHEVLFPYAKARMADFVAENRDQPEVAAEVERAKASLSERGWPCSSEADVVAGLLRYIDEDVKDTALKALQGMIWKGGFQSEAYRAHVYPEVAAALERWVKMGKRLSIYSSGSIGAQKLFFGHTEAGNLRPLLHTHFDTTTGHKREVESYTKIAATLERVPGLVLFLSDVPEELDAAAEAGMKTAQLVRPGTEAGERHPAFADFDALEAALLGPKASPAV